MSSAEIVCAGCGKICEDQSLVVNSVHFHVNCLVCNTCKKPLTGAFCQHDGKYYCVDDYKDQFLPKCAECNKPLEGKVIVTQGKEYHESCFKEISSKPGAPTVITQNVKPCAGCGQAIKSKIIVAMDLHWHEECFKCSKCDKQLSGAFYEVGGKPLCDKDHQAYLEQTAPKRNCFVCGNAISSAQFVETNGKHIHHGCLNCPLCKQGFIISDSVPDVVIVPGTNARVHATCYANKVKSEAAIASIVSKQTALAEKKSSWVATVDPESWDVYFVDTSTDAVTWDRPQAFNGPLLLQDGTEISPIFPIGAKYDRATNTVILPHVKLPGPPSKSIAPSVNSDIAIVPPPVAAPVSAYQNSIDGVDGRSTTRSSLSSGFGKSDIGGNKGLPVPKTMRK